MILPGMHKHIKEWDETLTARGLSTGALVHRIQDSMFTSEAEKRLSTKWNPPAVPEGRYASPFLICRTGHTVLRKGNAVPCSLGSVVCKVSRNTRSRRKRYVVRPICCSPGYVAARLSPSGLANRYGAIPFAFPASVLLEGLGALSSALVCRQRHDKPCWFLHSAPKMQTSIVAWNN